MSACQLLISRILVSAQSYRELHEFSSLLSQMGLRGGGGEEGEGARGTGSALPTSAIQAALAPSSGARL